MTKKIKVLLVNPWGVNNDRLYASGFVEGMSKLVDLDFACNYHYYGALPSGNIFKLFFKKSEKMQSGIIRTVIRGLEYFHAWNKLVSITRNNHYDIIHFHWLLMYTMDIKYIRRIKSQNSRIILTAHNIIPHVNGEKNIEKLRLLYGLCDSIIIHGEAVKKEFIKYFPEYSEKLCVQYHGYEQQKIDYIEENNSVFRDLVNFYASYEKSYIMFGKQFYNKGTDRLISIWKKIVPDNIGLIVLGKCDSEYKELDDLISAGIPNNILVINKFIDDNTLNYAISKSVCIILPYRHASMSGVVYTAAAFSKMIITTEAGSIAEYLENMNDSIVCGIDDESLAHAIQISLELSIDRLNDMGSTLRRNICSKYSWDVITENLFHNQYLLLLKDNLAG